jgi:hypothetical protein
MKLNSRGNAPTTPKLGATGPITERRAPLWGNISLMNLAVTDHKLTCPVVRAKLGALFNKDLLAPVKLSY